jgi:hypothetical protein
VEERGGGRSLPTYSLVAKGIIRFLWKIGCEGRVQPSSSPVAKGIIRFLWKGGGGREGPGGVSPLPVLSQVRGGVSPLPVLSLWE